MDTVHLNDGAFHPDGEALQYPELGPCCICEGSGARTIIFLNRKTPTPGRGWGCIECGLGCDGAFAVICDACARQYESSRNRLPIRFACAGSNSRERVAIDSLRGEHRHDMSKHR